MPVKVIAGCSATGRAPTARAGSSTASPWRPEVCTTYWPACRAPLALSTATTLRQHVVGDGQQQQVAGPGDRGRLGDGRAGQQGRRSGGGRRRTRRRPPRRGGRRRAGRRRGRRRRDPRRPRPPAGGRSSRTFRSSPSDHPRSQGRCGYQTVCSCSAANLRGRPAAGKALPRSVRHTGDPRGRAAEAGERGGRDYARPLRCPALVEERPRCASPCAPHVPVRPGAGSPTSCVAPRPCW